MDDRMLLKIAIVFEDKTLETSGDFLIPLLDADSIEWMPERKTVLAIRQAAIFLSNSLKIRLVLTPAKPRKIAMILTQAELMLVIESLNAAIATPPGGDFNWSTRQSDKALEIVEKLKSFVQSMKGNHEHTLD